MSSTIFISLVSIFCGRLHGLSLQESTCKRFHLTPPAPTTPTTVGEKSKWIEQKLDHFNGNDTRTWCMRYLANDQYFVSGGPIWIFVGGEWEITSEFLTSGHMHNIAKDQKGYIFSTEHRYYGQSHPLIDLQTENLKFLSVKQALADLAHFITYVKANIAGLENSKVMLAGSSYAGAMVTWFRRLCPNLVVGAWASSPPILAKVNFFEYKEVAGQSLKLAGGESCYNGIQNGFAEFEKMIAENRANELKILLQICEGFDENIELDVWNLFSQIGDYVISVVQFGKSSDIQRDCDEILKAKDDVTGLANYIVSFYEEDCNDFSYKKFIGGLLYPRYSSSAVKQWMYQLCTEFGWFRTADSKAQPFGSMSPEVYFVRTCRYLFGSRYTSEAIHKNADNTNAYFRGLNPDVERVYFTYGQLDPWHAVGLYDPNKATILPRTIITLLSHVSDFDSISPSDSKNLRASKQRIAKLSRSWLT